MSENTIAGISNALADAAETAGESTILVSGRHRFPSTGIAIRADLVMTADHTVERDEEIGLMLPDGREVGAVLAGREPASDLAVLRLSEPAAKPARFAVAEARVGEIALALGRPTPAGLQASLGVVSAVRGVVRYGRRGRHRGGSAPSSETFIYTDAVPFPGFSGGPLVNAAGEVLGMNTSGLVRGLSVAVPADRAVRIAEALAEHGTLRRGYLGLRSQQTPLSTEMQSSLGRAQEAGLLVVWTETGSPASEGGVIVGDILTAVGGQPVQDHESLQAAISGDNVGRDVELELLRGGRKAAQTIRISERKG